MSTDDAAAVAAALMSLDGWASEVRLIPPGVDVGASAAELSMVQPSAVRAAVQTSDAERQSTRWVLYTSGTTGEPKAISHSLPSLTRTVVERAGGSYVWGLLYDPNRMAGLQVILQGVLSGATVIAPSPQFSLPARLAELIAADVNALSATPSLWRQILQLPTSADLNLRQITLGGEIADQRVLDALATTFPKARIVHVFASTETGAAFSVKDGREGFPVSFLSDPPRGIRLDIRDDVLHVFSPDVSAAGDDGFASTGDIVEIVDDRVLFRGRSTGVVNIGGANVWPESVETILREHPDVVEAVVSAKTNPMTGNVLVATVTLAESADRDGVNKRLRSWVRDRAPRTHVPASVSVVEHIEVSATGKVAR
ncbi:AMP-binding protein [Ilumatobacter sp.]|uniref:AMP-binding protein n=1 Tax=Ilumatobacter sp. TaxID=1967498 RepID=UPI003AF9A223